MRDEESLVSPDAIQGSSRRFPRNPRISVGRHRLESARRATGARTLSRVSRRTRIRRGSRVRRHLLQRTSPERLWLDAITEPDRRGTDAPNAFTDDLRNGKFTCAL